MHITRITRETAAQARGVVIVIDVIRAFSVAGYAFAGGAHGLWLVRKTEEAQALRTRDPEALLAGEVDGRLIPGFDLNNSPTLVKNASVQGRRLIQRTGAGTQGAVAVANADSILLCALTTARATARYARQLALAGQGLISQLPTGESSDFTFGSEDTLCADYLEALLQERPETETQTLLATGIDRLDREGRFDLWKHDDPDFPRQDISNVLAVNRFNFAMVGTRQEWQGITYVDVRRVDLT